MWFLVFRVYLGRLSACGVKNALWFDVFVACLQIIAAGGGGRVFCAYVACPTRTEFGLTLNGC